MSLDTSSLSSNIAGSYLGLCSLDSNGEVSYKMKQPGDPDYCDVNIAPECDPFVRDIYGNKVIADSVLVDFGDPEDPGYVPPTFGDTWSTFYPQYTDSGLVLGATSGSEDPSIIKSFFDAQIQRTVTEFAQMFADYWATVQLTPGTPAHGGTAVISVTNNAATLVGPIAAAINGIITQSPSLPYFKELFDAVEGVITAQCQWVVTELMPPLATPTPFIETIS